MPGPRPAAPGRLGAVSRRRVWHASGGRRSRVLRRDDPEIGLLTEARRLGRGPGRLLLPGGARAQGDYGARRREILMESIPVGADQPQPGGLHRVLVRHDDDVAVGVGLIEAARHGGDPVGYLGQRLVDEVDGPWVGEVGLELTGEGAGDVRPWMAFPPAEKPPVAQVFVDADGDGGASCDLLSGPERRFQGGRPDGDDGPGAEITAHATGLFHAVGRETE